MALEPSGEQLDTAPPPTVFDFAKPLWRIVMALALPWWVQQLMHLVVNLSDALLAGRFLDVSGSYQVGSQAAQTTAGYLFWFISNFAILVSAGATAVVARYRGARQPHLAILAANQSLFLALTLGLVAGGLGTAFTREITIALGLEGPTADIATAYLRPIFIALPLQMLVTVGCAALVGAGDTASGMVVWSVVALANLPISWALCNGWWPAPAMGFVGIAVGTAISHAIGAVLVVALFLRGRAGLRLDWNDLWPDRPMIRRILSISIPAGVDSLVLAGGQLWFLSLVNGLGDVASAAHGIALRWEGLGYLSGGAFSVAASAMVGQGLGAGRPDLARHSGWWAFALGAAVMSGMGVIFFTLAHPMFALFCPKPEQQPIIEQGVPALRLIAFAMPAAAACFVVTGALRGAGDTRVPILFTLTGFFGVRLPLAYYLTGPAAWGLIGAWWAMCADLVVRGGSILLRFHSGKWQGVRL